MVSIVLDQKPLTPALSQEERGYMERDYGARQSAEQHLIGCGCLDY